MMAKKIFFFRLTIFFHRFLQLPGAVSTAVCAFLTRGIFSVTM